MSYQTIITNNKPRFTVDGYDLTPKEREQFDWMDDIDVHTFVRYRGQVIALDEFMRVDPKGSLAVLGYDGFHCDSYFSGTLIRFADDRCESVICALLLS